MKAHLALHLVVEDESGFAWAQINQEAGNDLERVADFQENLLILQHDADNVIGEMMSAVNAFIRHWKAAQDL